MPLPVHRREFDVFLSHAHVDRAFVRQLTEFLRDAGLSVFVDETDIQGGAAFPSAIRHGIERSRSAVVVATSDAVDQGWVRKECDIAIDESARDEAFRLIPIKVGDAPVGDLVRGVSWLAVERAELTPALAAGVLRSLYPQEDRPNPATSRDVYVSASWREGDSGSAKLVLSRLQQEGFRLIGDSRDQQGFGEDRIERIIASCGAFVCVIPYRDGVTNAAAGEQPYKYFLHEIDIATKLDIPVLVIADPAVHRLDKPDDGWLRMDTQADDIPTDIDRRLGALWDEWRQPSEPHYVFLAIDLDTECSHHGSPERGLIELVTGLPTTVGNEIDHDPVQHGILTSIRNSLLVIADISGAGDGFNLDASIEAGMAVACGINLRLVAHGKPRRPPFMLRTLQMPTYADDVGRLALFHKIARSYRRRVINAELR